MCDRLETAAKLANEQARKDQTEQERGIVEKKLMNGRVEKKGCKKGSMGNKLDWYGAKDNGGTGSKGKCKKAKVRAKLDTATLAESKELSE